MFDQTVDVIVVGSGYAGLAAAMEAHLAGASVQIIEKMAACGGNSIISDGGMAAAGTRFQRFAGIEDSPEQLVADMLRAGLGLNHRDLAMTVARRSAEALDWLIQDIGVVFRDNIDRFGGHSAPRSHIPEQGLGAHIHKMMLHKVRELGIPIRLRCRLTSLARNSRGRVTGVVAADGYRYNRDPGRPMSLGARRAVILATGGFAGDVEFRRIQDPRLDASVDSTNKASTTAGALKQALAQGAMPVQLSWVQLGPWTSADEKGFGAGPSFASYAGFLYGIMVDPQTGQRFVNELADRKTRADAILALGRPGIVIADASGVETAAMDIRRALKREVVRTFDSLDDLARHYSIPLKGMLDTVQRFNQAVRDRGGDEMGKPILEKAAPLTRPPYYAMRAWPKTHYTTGGVLIDTRARILNLENAPLEGLFAAGEITGGIHGASRLGTCAITDCLVFGRIAGQEAAKEEPQ